MFWRRNRDRDRDLERELRSDLELEAAEQIENGLPPKEAQYAAQRAFGNTAFIKEETRAMWQWSAFERMMQDTRYGLRMLRRGPVFALIAIASLALGIGANTAIFSLMDAILLRMLPVQHPEQLSLFGNGRGSGVSSDFPNGKTSLFSVPFYRLVRGKNAVYSDVAAIESMSVDAHAAFSGSGGDLEPVKMRLVSGNYFSLLGVSASLGRVLDAHDDMKSGASPVVVMSDRYWERRFAREPGILGRTLEMNGTAFTIVGVAAPEFFGTEVGEVPDFWTPLSMQAQAQPWLDKPEDAMTQSLWLFGRRKPGISIAQAQANCNLIFHEWLRDLAGPSPSAERIEDMRKASVSLMDASAGLSRLRRPASGPLRILMVLVGIVLLIACANVANLLLARGTARKREISVRLALGAPRRRLFLQLMSENLLLALAGGTLGVILAFFGTRLLLAMVSPGREPIPLDVSPNATVLLFTLGLSVFTGLLFGVVPALRSTGKDSAPSLQEGKGSVRTQARNRLGQTLVCAQVSLALFLMIAAGLFVRTLQNLETVNPGFDTEHVLLMQLDTDTSAAKGAALVNLGRRIERRIQLLPGVEAASFSFVNFSEGTWSASVWQMGVPHTEATAISFEGNRVGDQYFAALGIPVLAGRVFGPQDTPKSQKVAVVDETLARKLFPGVSPLGRRFDYGAVTEIVGVVKDIKHRSLREDDPGMFFLANSQEQDPAGLNDLVVRCARKPEAMIRDIRQLIRQEDPHLAIARVMTLRDEVNGSLSGEKLLAKLAGFFGLAALLLAAIGIYGVMAYQVAQRTTEIGIRMALGALPGKMLAAVVGRSLILVAIGFLIAIPAALACGKFIATQLYGVAPDDPLTLIAVAAMLLFSAALAAFVPARRAAGVDPMIALRYE